MKELKIGKIAVINGVKVQCIYGIDNTFICKKCAFYNIPCGDLYILCAKYYRKDGKNVYFKKIEDENN